MINVDHSHEWHTWHTWPRLYSCRSAHSAAVNGARLNGKVSRFIGGWINHALNKNSKRNQPNRAMILNYSKSIWWFSSPNIRHHVPWLALPCHGPGPHTDQRWDDHECCPGDNRCCWDPHTWRIGGSSADHRGIIGCFSLVNRLRDHRP